MKINWYKLADRRQKPTFKEIDDYRRHAIQYAKDHVGLIFGQAKMLTGKAPKQIYLVGSALNPKRFSGNSDIDLWIVMDEVSDVHALAGKIYADLGVYDVILQTHKPPEPFLTLYDEDKVAFDIPNLGISTVPTETLMDEGII